MGAGGGKPCFADERTVWECGWVDVLDVIQDAGDEFLGDCCDGHDGYGLSEGL